KFVLDKLELMLKQRREQSGVYDDLSGDSGLAVLLRFFEVLKRAEDNGLGKYLLCKFELHMKSSGLRRKSHPAPTFTIPIRDGERTAGMRKDDLQSEFEAECKLPDSPFSRVDALATRDDPFADAAETGIRGSYFAMKIMIKDQFNAFGGAKQ